MATLIQSRPARAPGAAIAVRPAAVLAWLVGFESLWRQRRQLAEMDAAQRADLGLSTGDIAQELARPAWAAPQHWVK